MNPFFKYFAGIFTALKNLIGGMKITWRELWKKKVTMQYPENRETLQISSRWRSELYMPHDENNEHNCTACGVCMRNCPNGTITVTHDMVETEDGKKKKVLNKHIWDYGMCTFCNICVITCPSDAIFFNNDFEGAMYDRSKLVHTLNKPGSKLKEKPKPAPKPRPAAAPAAKAEVKAEDKKQVEAEAKTEATDKVEAKVIEKAEVKPTAETVEKASAEAKPEAKSTSEKTDKE